MSTVVVLPAPFGPTSPTIFAGRDVETDAVHGPHLAERLFEALDLKDARGR